MDLNVHIKLHTVYVAALINLKNSKFVHVVQSNFCDALVYVSPVRFFFRLQHPSAARLLLEVGAVEFLSQLRPNVNGELHAQVDAILDNLFHLPDEEHTYETNECVYVYSDQEQVHAAGRVFECV